jgi:hypothetical protein
VFVNTAQVRTSLLAAKIKSAYVALTPEIRGLRTGCLSIPGPILLRFDTLYVHRMCYEQLRGKYSCTKHQKWMLEQTTFREEQTDEANPLCARYVCKALRTKDNRSASLHLRSGAPVHTCALEALVVRCRKLMMGSCR